jgi:hypothetical protein
LGARLGGDAQQALDVGGMALRALDGFAVKDKLLKGVIAFAAGVFV